ncbi:hypothetical protein [Microbacterium sp. PAMC21962]|uniref:hypothetical protein n=1 Tax=Microbacterium sp. PAMC21962 TaxID=2861280 RepID=UPI001C628D05|nr:hypothetical protein [Microbacterium sp. PAMC21962]QYF98105.1 hypothetical protein KY498_02290 [Microbacterium sp. PAMC21962]
MPKDPTANAAIRSIETADRPAALVFRGATSERVWLDRATARTLAGIIHVRRDPAGELHGRIKEEAAALLHQDDGEVTSKGNQS